VIAYMSLGIDVSRLYTEMVMASSTTDLVQKKMVYQYLTTYARAKPDLALLCINTLQRDCGDTDPMVCGLALRSLASLRMPNIVEYALPHVNAGLRHRAPYVRKTAVLAAVKLHNWAPQAVQDAAGDLLDVLYSLVRDADAQVVVNAILALNEILAADGGIALSSKLMLYLFNRLHEFPEWGQTVILELAVRYTPQSQDEMFDIMNLLEDRFRHANSAVVLATTKVFLKYTEHEPEIKHDVLRRLKAPLLTLVSASGVELAFVILSHIRVLAGVAPSIFADSYKQFFCRHTEPPCVKLVKIEILTLVASAAVAPAIITELTEYLSDADVSVAEASVRAVGRVGVAVPSATSEAVHALLQAVDGSPLFRGGAASGVTSPSAASAAAAASGDSGLDAVTAEAVVALRDVLRRFPELATDVLPALLRVFVALDRSVASANTNRAAAAVLWALGEAGEGVPTAPALLAEVVAAWAAAEESAAAADALGAPDAATTGAGAGAVMSPSSSSSSSGAAHMVELGADSTVRLEVLAAAAKLFFKRPAEMQPVLGRALALAVTGSMDGGDASLAAVAASGTGAAPDVGVRERGLLYYRLLSANVAEAARVIAGAPAAGADADEGRESAIAAAGGFVEPEVERLSQLMLDEFNSLSVVYGVPRSRFPVYAALLSPEEEEALQAQEHQDESDRPLANAAAAPGAAAGADTGVGADAPAAAAPADILGVADGDVAAAAAAVTGPTGDYAPLGPVAGLAALSLESAGAVTAGGGDVVLLEAPGVDPATFQSLWDSLAGDHVQTLRFTLPPGSAAAATPSTIEGALAGRHVFTMASGQPEPGWTKFFLYAGAPAGAADRVEATFLVECNVQDAGDATVAAFGLGGSAGGDVVATVKATCGPAGLRRFADMLMRFLCEL
jgi:AP-4 complex subunit beta-1